MELHICLSSCRSLEIHMNEDGRAAGGEQEEMHQFITNQVFHASAMEMRQREHFVQPGSIRTRSM